MIDDEGTVLPKFDSDRGKINATYIVAGGPELEGFVNAMCEYQWEVHTEASDDGEVSLNIEFP